MSRHKHECVECFDPKIIDIIRCVCSLEKVVDDVFKCLSCRPSTRRLQQLLTCLVLEDVRKIENLLTNETFGLSEIKSEVRQIENTVQAINNILTTDLAFISNGVQSVNNSVNSPAFGLQRIENDIQNVNNSVSNPAFGLRKIAADLQTVNNSVNNPTFGLQKIESEIRALENAVVGIYPTLTTGPVFINEDARHLTVQMQNNTSTPQTVNVKVMRIDKRPFQEIFNKALEIPPFAINEFRYIDLDSGDCCESTYGQIEVILDNLAPGLYPTMAQLNEDDRIIASSIFRCADFIPKTENYVS